MIIGSFIVKPFWGKNIRKVAQLQSNVQPTPPSTPQYYPWSAWLNDSTTGRLSPSKGLIFNFFRLILLTPIVVVYGLWCRKTIEKFWSQWAAEGSKVELDQEGGSTSGSFDDVEAEDFVNK